METSNSPYTSKERDAICFGWLDMFAGACKFIESIDAEEDRAFKIREWFKRHPTHRASFKYVMQFLDQFKDVAA